MKIQFFDDEEVKHLYPLTLTRPAADLRCGLLTIAEKWSHYFDHIQWGFETRDYLSSKYPALPDAQIRVNGRLLPSTELVYQLHHLEPGVRLMYKNVLLAVKPGDSPHDEELHTAPSMISRPFDLFLNAGTELEKDIAVVASKSQTMPLPAGNQHIGAHPVFIESGAEVKFSLIDTSEGPVYIGKNSLVLPGCMIQGPFAMAEGSVLKMGTKVYGKTALGPYTVIGGEVNNIQVQGYSNKAHDGFLGNAVLGEWCNIGADSNCSNLKNNYEEIKVWDYETGRFEKSGQQFCGLIMGDHSKCGINTMFNTGTVVGVSANIFGSGFPRQFIPDFAWGGASGFTTYKIEAACKTASLVMPRRKLEFTDNERRILEKVFEMTSEWRNWE